jgi:ElaB/YqjD/DUF883 family membrane-anchored ribosome-binding protein
MNATEISKERLITDLKAVVRDAEDLLKASAGDVSEKAREVRARLGVALERARETCAELEGKAIAGAKAADKVVRSHPYESMGVAFGVGLLIGVLVTRK